MSGIFLINNVIGYSYCPYCFCTVLFVFDNNNNNNNILIAGLRGSVGNVLKVTVLEVSRIILTNKAIAQADA